MYHPAKVEWKIEASRTAFLVETWDRNLFVLGVADDLDPNTVTEGDVVLLDYHPDPRFDVPTPRQVVAAVLDDEEAEAVWDRFQDAFEDAPEQQTAMMPMQNQQFEGGYIG